MPATFALLASAATDSRAAAALAERLGVSQVHGAPAEVAGFDALLLLDGDTLALQQTGPRAPGPVAVDFGSAAMRHRRKGGQNELLGRAVGVGRKPRLGVLDATAGLGRDSFVLADLGCTVLLCERVPVLAALLEYGLARARRDADPWLAATSARMRLRSGDARGLAPVELAAIDTIYLDPMFPPRGKSAAVKKDMALFQRLLEVEGDEADSAQLLLWALAQGVARVVVKRPLKAPCLAGRKPSHQLRGKAVRFDVYVLSAFTDSGPDDPGRETGGG